MWERDIKQKSQAWQDKEQTYKQDIINLENSIEAKVLDQEREKSQKLQELLDDTVALLGKDDIKTIGDIKALLKGQTLKELLAFHEQKQESLEQQLLTLAKQKIANKKEAKALVEQLEQNWKEDRENWEQEKTNLNQNYQSQKEAWNQEKTELNQARIEELTRLKSEWEKAKAELKTTHQNSLQEQKEFYKNQLQAQKEQNQTNEQTIQQLNQQITNLTQAQTENTQLQEQVNRQKTVLEQLLANREAQQEYKLEEFKEWMERNSILIPHWFDSVITDDIALEHLVKSRRYLNYHFDNPGYGGWTDRQEIIQKWLREQELTLLRGILNDDE